MWSKIGDICTVFSARRVHQSDWTKQGIPFYRAREIVKLAEHGYVDNELFISRELFEEFSRDGLMPDAGDIMISAVGTIGRTYIVQQTDKFYFKDASVLCLKNSHLNSDYLDIYLQSSFAKAQMISGSKGTTVDTITIEKANDYLIPIPPKDEQKRIIASIRDILPFINKIEAEKKELKRLVDKSKELVLELAIKGKLVPQLSSDEPALELLKRINPAFKPSDNLHYEGDAPKGWLLLTYKDIADYINGRAFKPEEWESEGLPIIRIQNLNEPHAPYNYSSGNFEKQYQVQKGDLLFAWAASLGVYIWKGEEAWLNQHIFKVIPFSCIDKEYLYYALSASINDFYQNSHGSGMVHITRKQFINMPLIMPPMNEQKRIIKAIKAYYKVLDEIVAGLR